MIAVIHRFMLISLCQASDMCVKNLIAPTASVKVFHSLAGPTRLVSHALVLKVQFVSQCSLPRSLLIPNLDDTSRRIHAFEDTLTRLSDTDSGVEIRILSRL